jgi:hypothetical protein
MLQSKKAANAKLFLAMVHTKPTFQELQVLRGFDPRKSIKQLFLEAYGSQKPINYPKRRDCNFLIAWC